MTPRSFSFTLAELAQQLHGRLSSPAGGGIEVSCVAASSKHDRPGAIFVAIPGTKSDGHSFLDEAFAHGAAAAVVTKSEALAGRPGIVVKDARAAASRLSALFCGEPTRDMQVVGITGTNGKTTTNFVIYHLFERLGVPAVRMGTIGYQAPGVLDESSLTTPDPLLIQRLLADGKQRGGARRRARSLIAWPQPAARRRCPFRCRHLHQSDP